ncbi:MAG TPA: transcriptional activator NhaR [Polyangiaceae bacterium LLY-WYZ-14_1]|nr:transcriptional activator NhaR [Polyangiaceae bacterium LLY-WYZ-14_1]
MEWLNYHHLLYFHAVAKNGSVSRAAEELRLTQPTVSGQVRLLEEALGEKLFERVGRRLELTEVGVIVYRYADEIFGLGRELLDTLRGRPTGRMPQLHVGCSDALPKLATHRLLEPALTLDPPVQVVVREDKTERLLGELSVRGLDLVLSDAPMGSEVRVKAFNHLLGESSIAFFATPGIAGALRKDFPLSLDGAPVLLPSEGTALRREIDRYFESHDLRPRVLAEFDDSALMKVFGEHGAGVFPAPTIIEADIVQTYGVEVVGSTDEVRERFYAITVERRIKHPAVAAISEAARGTLFR